MESIKKRLVTSRNIYFISLLVIILTILAVWLFGLGQHRTLFINSILSTSILSIAFMLFITIGLYKGIKMKEDMGKLNDIGKLVNTSKLPSLDAMDIGSSLFDIGEGLAGIVFGIIAWILISIAVLIFIWIFSTILWVMIIVFMAMLYWIFYRSLRVVFKNSKKCHGNLGLSLMYGIYYTVLYNFWIYGIIMASHYLI